MMIPSPACSPSLSTNPTGVSLLHHNIGNIYQEVAPLANDEGLRTLGEDVKTKQAELAQRDEDVFKHDANITRLQARHAALNTATVHAAQVFKASESHLMDLLIDDDNASVETIAQDHEAKRVNHQTALAALKHVVTTRLPKAGLDRLRGAGCAAVGLCSTGRSKRQTLRRPETSTGWTATRL